MSIRPEYQRRGLGSILMQHVCEDMDRHNRYGYVLASPAGVRLYSKFGFEAVGQVDTPYGPITSMLRGRVPLVRLQELVTLPVPTSWERRDVMEQVSLSMLGPDMMDRG
jgi:predicted N-acetyltransferase YhbS